MQSSSWSDSCLLPHAHILLCSHLFIYFLVLIQVTVDSNIEEVRLPILCTVKNLTLKKFQSPYSAWFHNLQIQPTKDCVILQYLLKKKNLYINELVQFNPILSKGQLYFSSFNKLSTWFLQGSSRQWHEARSYSLPRNWTWVAWMRTKNPSHQTSKG